MMTSFCMSWMTSAVREASSRRRSSVASLTRSPHVVESVSGDLALHAVHRGRRRDEQPVPVRAAPVDVAHVLGDVDRPEVAALGADHPDALGAGHVDVAALVELHAVDELA